MRSSSPIGGALPRRGGARRGGADLCSVAAAAAAAKLNYTLVLQSVAACVTPA